MLKFMPVFWESFTDLSREDQRRTLRAILQIDRDERAPALRVHKLMGAPAALWSASASRHLRITFERLGGGTKLLMACGQHYGD
jgi:hypothetical protein